MTVIPFGAICFHHLIFSMQLKKVTGVGAEEEVMGDYNFKIPYLSEE
jgi:hypothetical protein